MTSLTVVSSMATRAVLVELARSYEVRSGLRVHVESIGGVIAKKRVQAGETFDVVALSSEAIDELLLSGKLVAESKVDLARSGVAVAVRKGAPRPDIGSERALRQAVLAARSIGFSTGPSGVKLRSLLERWGILEALGERIVSPPPGIPVGNLVARGEVELGFQQESELLRLEGIDVLGPLPPEIQIMTIFSGAVGVASKELASARALLTYMASPESAPAKRRQGMEPA